jgi:Arc/MetJ family transcription regulator
MMRMKRTNVVLDEGLLREATQLSGEKTHSAAVSRALGEFVRRVRARQILQLQGTASWKGKLDEMRGRRPSRRG